MPPYEKALLINLLGHAAGTVIFAIFLALFLRDRVGARMRGSRLTGTAAALALIWNAGSLAYLLLRQPQGDGADEPSLLATASFSALSLLPAVLLHISLRQTMPWIRISAYLLSAAAVLLHCSEHWSHSEERHRVALFVITVGFGILTVASAAMTFFRGRTAPVSRLLGSMSLALFAMSFAHFGSHDSNAWSNELFFHHAGLPLAVFVLLQDYRFLLVDAFLRFVTSTLLAGSVVALALRVPLPQTSNAALRQSLTFAVFCIAMLVFAAFHGPVQAWLTRAVFRRPNAEDSAQTLRLGGPQTGSDDYLQWASQQLSRFLNAERVEAADALDSCGNLSPHPAADHSPAQHLQHQPEWVEAIAPLNGPPETKRLLLFGRRRGGRRYLSEDYAFLGEMAAIIGQRLNDFHAREMQRLVSEAELKALQSQINPHFLFNALNTIYGTIPRQSQDARRMVRNLSDIFRYALQAGQTAVTLESELEIVRAYLEIEQLRFGDRLRVVIEAPQHLLQKRIPMLTVQPLVENAIKHAIALRPQGGTVTLRVLALNSSEGGGLRVEVSDTGSGSASIRHGKGAEIGLTNVRRRLTLHFGSEAVVQERFDPQGSTVTISLPQQS
jgi:two-component system, LytTR family, sensor kinase